MTEPVKHDRAGAGNFIGDTDAVGRWDQFVLGMRQHKCRGGDAAQRQQRRIGDQRTTPCVLRRRALAASETFRQFRVLRQHGTERPGSSELNREKRPGTFLCAGCGQPLFSSDTKYESGSGWPSFWAPLDGGVATREDRSLMMARTEVLCSRCQGHLGHVFPDGPRPTGQRFCMNGAALRFQAAEDAK